MVRPLHKRGVAEHQLEIERATRSSPADHARIMTVWEPVATVLWRAFMADGPWLERPRRDLGGLQSDRGRRSHGRPGLASDGRWSPPRGHSRGRRLSRRAQDL